MNTRTRSRRAFTLLEILLVVGLLALLASFAIPRLVGAGEKAKIKLVEAAIGSNGPISMALKLYKVDCDQYPEELKELMEKPSDDDLEDKWSGPYLEDKSGLLDPWKRDYQYKYPGEHNEDKFDLWSDGPDMDEGTDDDIVNWEDDR